MSRIYFFALLFLSVLSYSLKASPGLQLPGYARELAKIFPEADRFTEESFRPETEGGSTFQGLVTRLLGEGLDRDYEGISTPRFIYRAFNDRKLVGIGHGSSVNTPSGVTHVYVFYDMDRRIKNMRIDGLPNSLLSKLHEGGFLSQFIGHEVEDFEKQRTRAKHRRSREKSWRKGDFLVVAKKPQDPVLLRHFEGILRSVRFNAAFVDVAFFITKHPELDELERISNEAVSGPEKVMEGVQAEQKEGSVIVEQKVN